MASWTKRQGEVTSHSRSYGEELQRSIFVQIASAIGDLENAIGINIAPSFSHPVIWISGTFVINGHSIDFKQQELLIKKGSNVKIRSIT